MMNINIAFRASDLVVVFASSRVMSSLYLIYGLLSEGHYHLTPVLETGVVPYPVLLNTSGV